MTPLRNIAIQTILYGSHGQLPRLLRGLDRLETDGCNVVVRYFDNGPGEGPPSIVHSARLRVPCHYARSERGNIGFGAAQNLLAADAGEADYLLLLNPDTIPFHNMLLRLVAAAEANPRAAMIEAAQFPIEHQKAYDPATGQTDWSCGAAVLVRGRMFRELDGFDERLFLYCEDVDLSWRAWLAGYECIYEPLAKCVHVSQEEDIGKDRSAEIYNMELGNLYLRAKYFGEHAVADHFDWLAGWAPAETIQRLRSDLARIAPERPLGVSHPRITLNNDHRNYGPVRW